jgi:hypothetical protein
MTGGDTISYDVSKQYIRLSTPILQLCEKKEIDGVEQLQLNPHFTHPDITDGDITALLQSKSERTWDSIVVAILRCEDDFGYIAMPLRRLNSGEFERFASWELSWLRTRSKEWRPLQNVFVRSLRAQNIDRTQPPSRSIKSPRNLLIKSFQIEGSSYYISGGYPPNFIAAPGEKPTEPEAVARINKAASIVTPIILFFAHEWSADHPPFAIRFDRFGSTGNYAYHICCRVGPSIKDWEKGKLPVSLQEDDKVVDVDTQIPVSEDKSLVIRLRNAPQSLVRDFVNLSIETRLPWQRQT